MIGNLTWVELAWPMMASVCLALAGLFLAVWLRRRERWDFLIFAGAALSVAAVAGHELVYMHAETTQAAIAVLRWVHLPLTGLALSLAGFAHFYFGGVRRWLFLGVLLARGTVLGLAFGLPHGIFYERVTALRQVDLPGGAKVSALVGDVSPWSLFASASWVFLLLLFADSARAAWRRSPAIHRSRIARVGGVTVGFIALTPVHAQLVRLGVFDSPFLVTPFFCAVVLAIAIDLTGDIARSSWLAESLRSSEVRLREAEIERELAEERFRRIVESAPSALIIVDAAGRIQFGNRLAVEVLGYSREELSGLELEQLLPERLRSRHQPHRDGYMKRPSLRLMGAGLELVGRRKDGSEFPIEVSLAPLPVGVNHLAVAMFTDTTKRREQELAAARLRAELSHLSRVAVLGELSASLAHEINQPLAAILNNAEAARRYLERDTVDVAVLREIVGDIVADDVRAGEVIRRLRAMLRKEELPRVPLDLNEVVRGVLQIMHSDLINRGVAIELVAAPDLPAVRGDAVQLQQVILNLIVNACDAMGEASARPSLTVRTCHEGGEVRVEVSDQGIGIPDADLERIFDPFVTSKAQGTGLGLSVCRTIVTAHEGRIWARNNSGAGATLTVALSSADRARE